MDRSPPRPDGQGAISRRLAMTSALALAACGDRANSQPAPTAPLTPLKRAAHFPVGCAAMAGQFDDPGYSALITAQFGQITPEWEMKMESILKDDGGFDFSRSDAIAAAAASRGLRLHGHTLIWYSQGGPAFQRIDGQRAAFANAYRNYIQAVAGRYRGRVVSWDVVNEPITDDGSAYRDCLWSKNLGMDYVAEAFRIARAADPNAVLFLNDYNLEATPKKRRQFLRLAESVLKAGAPLGGLGTQTHLDLNLAPGMVTAAIRDLASLGLPIHVSEMDVSTRGGLRSMPERLDIQARLVGETVDAFMALPQRQRFAITAWGLRDKDSWLRRAPNAGDGSDRPLLFDDAGRPKPAARRFVQAVSKG